MNTRELLIKKYSTPQYIGDNVYIHFDGYHFVLERRYGYSDDPRNVIALEPDVIENLLDYRHRCYEQFEKLDNRGEII